MTEDDLYISIKELAAQKQTLDKAHDDKIDGCHILRVGKEHATFTHHYFGELPGCLLS